MQLASVRALKQEVAVDLVAPAVASAFALGRAGVAAGSMRTRVGPERAVALGVAAGGRKGQYRLAVRIQRHELRPETEGDLHERLRRLCRDELDVRYVGRLFKQAGPDVPWQQRRHRPLRIGTSVGHAAVTAGTLGSFAVRRATGEMVILSANHVLANENRAKAGQAILQPGRFDGGRRPRAQIGALLEFVPLQRQANRMDAAIASDRGRDCRRGSDDRGSRADRRGRRASAGARRHGGEARPHDRADARAGYGGRAR